MSSLAIARIHIIHMIMHIAQTTGISKNHQNAQFFEKILGWLAIFTLLISEAFLS